MQITYAVQEELGNKCLAALLPLTITSKVKQSNFLISWLLTLTFSCTLTRVRIACCRIRLQDCSLKGQNTKTKVVIEKALSGQKKRHWLKVSLDFALLKIKGQLTSEQTLKRLTKPSLLNSLREELPGDIMWWEYTWYGMLSWSHRRKL